MTDRRYGEPAALRQALTDQLRRLALARPGAQLADLQRQFAYDRLLARVFVAEPEAWVVKGATALLARMHGSARHTVDIDLYLVSRASLKPNWPCGRPPRSISATSSASS